jgi:hypothetical protein
MASDIVSQQLAVITHKIIHRTAVKSNAELGRSYNTYGLKRYYTASRGCAGFKACTLYSENIIALSQDLILLYIELVAMSCDAGMDVILTGKEKMVFIILVISPKSSYNPDYSTFTK